MFFTITTHVSKDSFLLLPPSLIIFSTILASRLITPSNLSAIPVLCPPMSMHMIFFLITIIPHRKDHIFLPYPISHEPLSFILAIILTIVLGKLLVSAKASTTSVLERIDFVIFSICFGFILREFL